MPCNEVLVAVLSSCTNPLSNHAVIPLFKLVSLGCPSRHLHTLLLLLQYKFAVKLHVHHDVPLSNMLQHCTASSHIHKWFSARLKNKHFNPSSCKTFYNMVSGKTHMINYSKLILFKLFHTIKKTVTLKKHNKVIIVIYTSSWFI